MAKLDELHQRYIVTELACYAAPTDVQSELKARYGVEISVPGIVYYDPDTAEGHRLAEKWKTLFRETRAALNLETSKIPIANVGYRLKRLQRIVESSKSPMLQMQAMKQAAEDAGGRYTNKISAEHSGKDGGAIVVSSPEIAEATKELTEWRKLMNQMIPSMPPEPEQSPES